MVLNTTVLFVEETGENHRPAASHWQTLPYNVVSSIPRLNGILTGFIEGYILLPDILVDLYIYFLLPLYCLYIWQIG